MKALVTGGGGFLGSYIVKELLKKGDSVRVFGRRYYPELDKIGVDCFQGNLTKKEDLVAACEGMDIVYHVAALPGIVGSYNTFYQTNVTGTAHVIHGCLKNGIKKLVYTSSPSVVFNGKDMQNADETVEYPAHFENFYSQTKALAEKAVLEQNGKNGLMTCSLRPHLIWGPGDNNLIPRFLKRGKAGSIKIVGDGTNLVDAVYVENAAKAHVLAGEKLFEGSNVCGQAYFITNAEPVRLFDWINRFLEGAGIAPVNKKIPVGTAVFAGFVLEKIWKYLNLEGEPRMTRFLAKELATHHWFNPEKSRNDLGYEPQISMEEGFKKTFESAYFKELVQQLNS